MKAYADENAHMQQDHYQDAIDQLFVKLERQTVRPKVTASIVTMERGLKNAKLTVAGAAILTGVAAFGSVFVGVGQGTLTEVQQLPGFLGGVTSIFVGGATLMIAVPGSDEQRKVARVFDGFLLGLVGRALPLNEKQVETLNTWATQHPRLLDTLAKWGAANPDGQLNSRDFRRVERTVSAVEKLETYRTAAAKQDEIHQTLNQSPVGSAIRKRRMSGQIDEAPRAEGPKRAL